MCAGVNSNVHLPIPHTVNKFIYLPVVQCGTLLVQRPPTQIRSDLPTIIPSKFAHV